MHADQAAGTPLSAANGIVTDHDEGAAPASMSRQSDGVEQYRDIVDLPKPIVVPEPPTIPAVAKALGMETPAPANVSDVIDFEARIDKSGGQKLGLDVSAYDGKTLLCGLVRPGPVEAWNMKQGEGSDMCVRRGDRIIAVNRVEGDSDLLMGATRQEYLIIKVRRLLEFSYSIDFSSGDNLGVMFEDMSDGQVAIVSLYQGIISTMNENIPADVEIRVGDLVLRFDDMNVTGADALRTAVEGRLASQSGGFLSFRIHRAGPHALLK